MQLKNNHPEVIKSEIFDQVYNKILKGEIKDKQLINSVFKYFHGNSKLFEVHYQHIEPTNKTFIINKKCFSCGEKGHFKRHCQVQGLIEKEEQEEEIEFIISQKPSCRNCKSKGHWEENCPNLIKEEEFYRPKEVRLEEIPNDTPYDFSLYED